MPRPRPSFSSLSSPCLLLLLLLPAVASTPTTAFVAIAPRRTAEGDKRAAVAAAITGRSPRIVGRVGKEFGPLRVQCPGSDKDRVMSDLIKEIAVSSSSSDIDTGGRTTARAEEDRASDDGTTTTAEADANDDSLIRTLAYAGGMSALISVAAAAALLSTGSVQML